MDRYGYEKPGLFRSWGEVVFYAVGWGLTWGALMWLAFVVGAWLGS